MNATVALHLALRVRREGEFKLKLHENQDQDYLHCLKVTNQGGKSWGKGISHRFFTRGEDWTQILIFRWDKCKYEGISLCTAYRSDYSGPEPKIGLDKNQFQAQITHRVIGNRLL